MTCSGVEPPANAAAVVIGSPLQSNGNGCLAIHDPANQDANVTTDAIVAYALEAVNNSAVAAVARIKVEVA